MPGSSAIGVFRLVPGFGGARMCTLRHQADEITARILHSDEPWIDIRIAIENLRDEVKGRFPDRVWLFEALYMARWERLREQGWAHERSEF